MTTIRPLRRDDIAGLQKLDRAAHGEAWSYKAFVDQIENPAVRHLVAEDAAGNVVGHAGSWREGRTLRVTNVAVAASASGRGVATGLLLELFGDPRDCDRIELEVRPSNRSAQRLYSRFGFAPVGVVRNFYERRDTRGSRDAVVMAVTDPHAPDWRERLVSLDTTGKGAAA